MANEQFTHIDLFSGIGGFTLAAEWAGFKTIVFCEKEKFCQKVLKARFGAIADSKQSRLERRSWNSNRERGKNIQGKQHNKNKMGSEIGCDDRAFRKIPIIPEIRDFDGTKYRGATLLTGGFPCQPFSVAGQRRGKEDDRYLWPEMLRVINEAKPHWIFAENVPGIFRMALDTVLADLEGEGYATGTFIIPACGLNAPHRRNRIWIVAHYGMSQPMELSGSEQKCRNRISNSYQATSNSTGEREKSISQQRQRSGIKSPDSKPSNSTEQRLEGAIRQVEQRDRGRFAPQDRGQNWQENWLEVATRLCRMDDGISDRIHRLKALGNAIVPQIAYEILKNIAWIEREHYD